ncbi:MAG: hypothetical protein AMJ65_06085 [Phycisphaerae bacterium SG8_4]|nr:MAG: hypothetical protein AMJ65_06085 [Phycisphaerae bacterium SG8_4]
MAEEIRVVELTADNMCQLACCGIKDTEHEGRIVKTKWMNNYFKKGLKAKIVLGDKDIQAGYIEYLPGQYAWRAVDANGYMFIHCLWIHLKKYQKQGHATRLIQSCIDDARKAKTNGVAVIARKKPWLANSEIFLKSGFEVIDTAPPDYELLVKKFKVSTPNPRLKDNWDRKLNKYGKGLTIIRSNQCPHTVRFADKIAEMAEKTYRLKPQMVELRTYRDAQNAPTPYSAFAVIYNGQLLADHQISATRFRNIMNKVLQ